MISSRPCTRLQVYVKAVGNSGLATRADRWTITFGVLYCFFVIAHDRRRILHFNVTKHPTSLWIVQQLREAFPFELAPRFLIFDRDAKYGWEVPSAIQSLKVRPLRTRSGALGRMASPNAGSAVAGATCWITSSRSMNAS